MDKELENDLLAEVIAEQAARDLVNEFLNIQIGDKSVNTPFWMNNDPDLRSTRLYFSVPKGGKLSPDEIRSRISQLVDTDTQVFADKSVEEVGELLRGKGIGVDCSGFSYQIARRVFESLGGVDFENKVMGKEGGYGITKVNANDLTSYPNSIEIRQVGEIKPGDLIRGLDGKHVLVIIGRYDDVLKCAHSSDGVRAKGVSAFSIKLVDFETDIFHQEWSEYHVKGIKYNERLLQLKGDRDGLWRLKVVNSQYTSF